MFLFYYFQDIFCFDNLEERLKNKHLLYITKDMRGTNMTFSVIWHSRKRFLWHMFMQGSVFFCETIVIFPRSRNLTRSLCIYKIFYYAWNSKYALLIPLYLWPFNWRLKSCREMAAQRIFNQLTIREINIGPVWVTLVYFRRIFGTIGHGYRVTQPPPREGVQSALFSNLSKSGLDNYVVKRSKRPLLIPITGPKYSAQP